MPLSLLLWWPLWLIEREWSKFPLMSAIQMGPVGPIPLTVRLDCSKGIYPVGWTMGSQEVDDFMNKPLWGQDMWKTICILLQEAEAVLTVFLIPAHMTLTSPNDRKLLFCSGLSLSRWHFSRHRRLGAQREWPPQCPGGWHIAKDDRSLLKYSDLINEVTAGPMCSQWCPRQVPKKSGAIHQSSQLMRNWWIDYIGPSHPEWSYQICPGLCGHSIGPNLSFPLSPCKAGCHQMGAREEDQVWMLLWNRQWSGATFSRP